MQVTKQQRANLLEALNVMWPSVPPENVAPRLRFWRDDPDNMQLQPSPPSCGTIACFGGWCAMWPNFMAQGVSQAGSGAPRLNNSSSFGASSVAGQLFGDPNLFAGRGGHDADRGVSHLVSDHQLVKRRLEWVLARTTVKGTV